MKVKLAYLFQTLSEHRQRQNIKVEIKEEKVVEIKDENSYRIDRGQVKIEMSA